jgi:hypothetical protein
MCRVLQDRFSQPRAIIRPPRAGETIQPGRTAAVRTADSEATAVVRPTVDRMADPMEAAAIIRRPHRMAPAHTAVIVAVPVAITAEEAVAVIMAAPAEVLTEVTPDANT